MNQQKKERQLQKKDCLHYSNVQIFYSEIYSNISRRNH